MTFAYEDDNHPHALVTRLPCLERGLRRASLPILLLSLSLAGFVGDAAAATFYVSPTGSDANPGTLTQPLRTISRAASLTTPGSTVYVRSGTYYEVVRIHNSGASGSPIRYLPYGSERAIIDGATGVTADLVTITGSHVEFRGFEVRNARLTGIGVWGTRFTRVIGNRIHGSQRGAIWIGHDTRSVSTDNLAEQNVVFNNGLMNVNRNSPSGWPVTIMAELSDRTILRANTSYRNYGEGLGALSSSGVQIVNNVSYDNYSVLIYLDNCQSSIVRSNFVYSTGDTRFYRNGLPATGIAIANEDTAVYLRSSANHVLNNIAVGVRRGFEYGNYQVGGGMLNSLVANNTFVNAVEAAIKIDPDNHSGNRVLNNIFYRASPGPLEAGTEVGTSFSHNCWFGGSAGAFAGSGDVESNPLVASPGSLAADGYRLLAGSPCAASGDTLSETASDYSGVARTAPYSAGAFESQDEEPWAQLEVTSPLVLSPASPVTGQVTTAAYTVRNNGSTPVTIPYFLTGARNPANAAVDFPASPSVTLSPGQSYTYRATRTFSSAGTHTAWPAFYRGGSTWVQLAPPRTFTVQQPSPGRLTVSAPLALSPSAPCVSTPVTATFVVKNDGNTAITVQALLVAVRSPTNQNADFPQVGPLTLQPGSSYTYRQSRSLGDSGTYTTWAAAYTSDWRELTSRITFAVHAGCTGSAR